MFVTKRQTGTAPACLFAPLAGFRAAGIAGRGYKRIENAGEFSRHNIQIWKKQTLPFTQ